MDPKTGHFVTRMGDVRIVTKRDADSVTVLTAMRAGEFSDYAG